MKIPRDITGTQLVRALRTLDYSVTRQRGSHIRITTELNGQHHEVIPKHNPLKPGTLAGILKSIASHHQMSVQELIQHLDL